MTFSNNRHKYSKREWTTIKFLLTRKNITQIIALQEHIWCKKFQHSYSAVLNQKHYTLFYFAIHKSAGQKSSIYLSKNKHLLCFLKTSSFRIVNWACNRPSLGNRYESWFIFSTRQAIIWFRSLSFRWLIFLFLFLWLLMLVDLIDIPPVWSVTWFTASCEFFFSPASWASSSSLHLSRSGHNLTSPRTRCDKSSFDIHNIFEHQYHHFETEQICL